MSIDHFKIKKNQEKILEKNRLAIILLVSQIVLFIIAVILGVRLSLKTLEYLEELKHLKQF